MEFVKKILAYNFITLVEISRETHPENSMRSQVKNY